MAIQRVGIIGYGRSGRDIHTRLLKQLPDQYRIVAYVERDADRQALIAAEQSITADARVEDWLGRDDLDLVIVASNSDDHVAQSRQLLAAGFNVVSEKPAAGSLAAFDSVLEVARDADGSYFVFQQYRFSPSFEQIQSVIASGVLGRIVQVSLTYSRFGRRWDWQTVHGMAAGSLLNTGPHPVDHALALMGFPQPDDLTVFAHFDRTASAGDAEDHVKVVIRAPGAPLADIEISACDAFAADTYSIRGTHGSLYGNPKHLDWTYYREDENEPRPLITTPLKNERNEPIYCREQLVMHEESWDASEADGNARGLAYYRALHAALTAGEPFPITADQIRTQMHVITEAHRQNAALFG